MRIAIELTESFWRVFFKGVPSLFRLKQKEKTTDKIKDKIKDKVEKVEIKMGVKEPNPVKLKCLKRK